MAASENTKPFYNSAIPGDWDAVALGKIAKVTSGGTPSREKKSYWGGNIPWITTSLIDFNEIESADQFITDEGLRNSSTKLFPSGTLLMALYGQGKTRGKTAILRINASTNQACAAIILDDKKADKKFIFQYLVSKYEDIRKLSNTGNQENLNGELVKSIRIKLPPLAEQKAIARVLGLMDSAINQNNQLIVQKELRKKWLMQNLLTGKKRLKGFSGEWKEIRIGDSFRFIGTHAISRDALSRDPEVGSINCVHYGDIHALYQNSFLDFSAQRGIPRIIDLSYKIADEDYIRDGDVIMADASEDYAGVGEAVEVVGLGKGQAVGGLHTFVLRGDKKITSLVFRGYLFLSEGVRNALRRMATGSSVYGVTKSTVAGVHVTIPTEIEEQTAIAQVLQAADKEIQLLKTKTEKLQEQKKGMMQQLLTGKKRLKIED